MLQLISAMDEGELVRRFKDESTRNEAFSAIIKLYQKKVYWHIRKMVLDHDDADDLTQNTFVKIWQHLNNFREDSKLYTWVYRIATNECLNFLKSKRNQYMLPFGELESKMLEKLESDPLFTGDSIQRRLQKAILTLPDKQRLVFNMKYFDALKYEEISEVLGTSVGALKASYHHAVTKIEIYLKEEKYDI